MAQSDRLTCPNCRRSDNVRKASAIINQETATAGYTTSLTSLARHLLPPPEPEYKSPWGWGSITIIVLIVLMLGGLLSNPGTPTEKLMATAFWSIPIIGFIVWKQQQAAANRARHKKAREKWQRAKERWGRLFYCGRCDGVFVPGETRFVSTPKMDELLYEPAAQAGLPAAT